MITWFRQKLGLNLDSSGEPGPKATTKQRGDAAEQFALTHLQRAGLILVARNFKTPGRGGGEIDLIMRDRDGCLVFVEVRARASDIAGGAAASITATKRRRIVFAARQYLARLPHVPPCRFDVVAIGESLTQPSPIWIKSAFDADD